MTWQDARRDCAMEQDSDLVNIETADENDVLQGLLGDGNSYWISEWIDSWFHFWFQCKSVCIRALVCVCVCVVECMMPCSKTGCIKIGIMDMSPT